MVSPFTTSTYYSILRMFYVYILYSEKFDKNYIGQTSDLQKRLNHHNSGLDTFTKKYLPWKLLYAFPKPTRSEAIHLEKKLKNLSRQRLLELIIKHKKI
jgi:putative endonuclease